MTTFAGRRDRMSLLLREVRAAVAAGIIDEWHVWDFARKPEDRDWLAREFPNLRHLPDKMAYRPLGRLEPDANGAGSFEMGVRAESDLHIRLIPTGRPGAVYELVLGGWGNLRSALRVIDGTLPAAQALEVLNIETPGLLASRLTKTLRLAHQDGLLTVKLNGHHVLQYSLALPGGPVAIQACTGFGSDGEIYLQGAHDDRELLFGARNDTRHPFGEFYRYYAAHYEDYRDAVFLKSDDDILYFDQYRLADFIKFRIANEHYFLLSANVLNNGVCAYFQQQAGLIPPALMDLELPPGGFCGRLWSSPAWAAALHRLFLSDPACFTGQPRGSEVIEWDQRLSINFIAWLGRDLAEMACQYEDDEQSLSLDIPRRLARVNAIYTPFYASHLSFYAQDPGMDVGSIIAGYAALR